MLAEVNELVTEMHDGRSPAMRFIHEASSMPRLLLRILRMFPRTRLRCSEVTVLLQTDAGRFSGPRSHQYDR